LQVLFSCLLSQQVLLEMMYRYREDPSSSSMLDEYERQPMHLLKEPDVLVTAFLQGPSRLVLAVHGIVERAALPACGSNFAVINMALAALYVSKAVSWGPLVFPTCSPASTLTAGRWPRLSA